MNVEQVASIVRQILLFVGGLAVGKGWIDNQTMVTIAGAAATIVGSVWALWSRTNKSIVASAAAKVPVSPSSQAAVGITEPVAPSK